MKHKAVFLTFDDGPIPEVTPWVLDLLDHYGIKATFFCVGDNVRKHPETFRMVVERGHSVGNHTMHHLQGAKVTTSRYVADIMEAHALIDSPLFRPPHGLIRWKQAAAIKDNMRIIMYDLVTRDYSKKTYGRTGARQRATLRAQRVNHRVSRLSEIREQPALCPATRHRMA